MTFLHLWAIGIGVAAVSASLVIHRLTKPRPVRMPFSTLRFVRDVIRQRSARNLVRNILILSLRTLAIAMLALAVARPLMGPQPPSAARQSSETVRIVLVDVSQSMGATVGSTQPIVQARALAANRYLQFESGLWANLILAGASPRAVFEGPTTNFEALRDELSRCKVLPERIDVKAALERAGQMLAPTSEHDMRRRELVIFSDFQRSNWGNADFSALPTDTVVMLESNAPKEPLANLAVLRAEVRADRTRAGRVRVEIDVGNFTSAERKMTVNVALGDVYRRLEGICPVQGRVTLADEMEIPGSGWQWGQAELVTAVDPSMDALAADNVRPLVIQLRPKPTYVLLTRQPVRIPGAAGRLPSSSFYLECALAPDGQLGSSASATIVRIDPANLDAKDLATADLVCLDHPGKLSDGAINLLSAALRRGRPLFYVAGEAIDATNLKRLTDAGRTGLHMPVEFVPPTAGSNRQNLHLKSVRADVPPFSVFGDKLSSLIGGLRFTSGLSSRLAAGGRADDVLATYSDGSACLVSCACDTGMLVVLNADLAASNLPSKAMFVPLVQSLADRIMNRNASPAPVRCGERLSVQLPPDVLSANGLRNCAPQSDSPHSTAAEPTSETSGGRFGELVEEGAGVVWNWHSPDRPGVYRVCRDDATVFAQAVEIRAEESQLEYLVPEAIRRLAAGREVYYRSAGVEVERRDDLWVWFAVACAVCGLGELTSLIALKT